MSTRRRDGNDKPIAPPDRKGSRGFFRDVLTDPMGTYTPYRFQMLVWTAVLSIVFWGVVYDTLAMPEFDNTMLALMGISSGAYLGAKAPENKAAAAT